jgi:hypothetical protein
MRTWSEILAMGLSADCKLNPVVVLAIYQQQQEHPCDRCNMSRKVCHGYPRADGVDPDKLVASAPGEKEPPA